MWCKKLFLTPLTTCVWILTGCLKANPIQDRDLGWILEYRISQGLFCQICSKSWDHKGDIRNLYASLGWQKHPFIDRQMFIIFVINTAHGPTLMFKRVVARPPPEVGLLIWNCHETTLPSSITKWEELCVTGRNTTSNLLKSVTIIRKVVKLTNDTCLFVPVGIPLDVCSSRFVSHEFFCFPFAGTSNFECLVLDTRIKSVKEKPSDWESKTSYLEAL